MKNNFILPIVLFLFLFSTGRSQNFNFYNTTDSMNHATSIWVSVYSSGSIQNLSAVQTLTIDVIRLKNDHNPPWFSSICTDVCYPTLIDSTVLILPPGQTQQFKNYFAFLNHNLDTAHTKILFSNRQNPANYFIHNYYCVDDSASIFASIKEIDFSNQLSVYPNPFSSETSVHINNHLDNATLNIYNSHGQLIKHIQKISGQTVKLYRDNLPVGLYYIRLTDKGKLATKKLIITD